MLKDYAKDMVGRAVSAMPWGARRAAFEALVRERGRFELLRELAAELGASGFTATGRHGTLQGSIHDRYLLQWYGKQGEFAERSLGLFREIFAPAGGTYLDIGANIGLTLVPIGRDARVRCHGFEPDATNFANLDANVAVNCRAGNVTLHNLALYARPDTLRFGFSQANTGDSRLASAEGVSGLLDEAERQYVEVRAERLDDLLPEAPAGPLGVKIDTQGAEPFVVEGGQRTLAAAELIVMEFWPYGLARLGGDPAVVLDFLRAHFAELALAETEEHPAGPARPAAEVCERLARMAVSERDNPDAYVDIVARRAAA